MKNRFLLFVLSLGLGLVSNQAAIAQSGALATNKVPKCLATGVLPSGGEYKIRPLLNFSYDIELKYKALSSQFPVKVEIVKSVRKGQGSSITGVKIIREIPAKDPNEKLIFDYKSLKVEEKMFLGWFADSPKPMPLNLIAKAIYDGEKVLIKDKEKAYELQMDKSKIKSDLAFVGPKFKEIFDKEAKKLCRNVYEFDE